MRFAQEISIFNPYAIERQVIALSTSITQTAREIELRADELYAEKGQVVELDSRLTIMAGQISSEVTERQNGDVALQSLINQSAHTISMSVSGRASKSSGASITITMKDANGNTISSGSGNILIDGNAVFTNQLSTAGQTVINGENITTGIIHDANNNTQFNLSTGALTMKKGTITLGATSGGYNFTVTDAGALTAKSGKIADFTIGATGLYYGKDSFNSAAAGLYIGPEGFAVGQNGRYTGFQVRADGTPVTNYLKFQDNAGHESHYGLWCDSYERIGSGGAIWVNQEHQSSGGGNYIMSPSIIDGYQRLDSDRRVKKNIRYMTQDECSEFILALKPVEYEFNDERQAEAPEYWRGVRHGFIAQDVVEVLGDEAENRAIVNKNWEGYYEFKYDELTADLVGICQAHNKRIDELEGRINQIEQLHEGDGK